MVRPPSGFAFVAGSMVKAAYRPCQPITHATPTSSQQSRRARRGRSFRAPAGKLEHHPRQRRVVWRFQRRRAKSTKPLQRVCFWRFVPPTPAAFLTASASARTAAAVSSQSRHLQRDAFGQWGRDMPLGRDWPRASRRHGSPTDKPWISGSPTRHTPKLREAAHSHVTPPQAARSPPSRAGWWPERRCDERETPRTAGALPSPTSAAISRKYCACAAGETSAPPHSTTTGRLSAAAAIAAAAERLERGSSVAQSLFPVAWTMP